MEYADAEKSFQCPEDFEVQFVCTRSSSCHVQFLSSTHWVFPSEERLEIPSTLIRRDSLEQSAQEHCSHFLFLTFLVVVFNLSFQFMKKEAIVEAVPVVTTPAAPEPKFEISNQEIVTVDDILNGMELVEKPLEAEPECER
jgi:hypothetical protein